jgi:PadR family transcriptional regulator PadR
MRNDGAKGHLDLVLLGALGAKPGHGYAIISAIKAQSGGVLDLPEGTIYPALHRLEDLGWVTSEWKPVAGRRRREYSLTSEGKRAFTAERTGWTRLTAAINAVISTSQPAAGGRLAGGLA